ncbi:MAG: hypothetical protein OXI60_05085 [Acidiferrobacterales bacterium]|nr:hypothetical protein [Acidiferrobacterales bacterium]
MSHPYNLGEYFESINITGKELDTWLNRGMIWLYGFDLEMSFRCFRRAAEIDPNDAMAYWGMAYTSGIYYNKPWDRMQKDELADKLQLTYQYSRQAKQKSARASDWQRMIIDALQVRYQSPTPVEFAHYERWNDDYANAMRLVFDAHPEHDDVTALFAEALMTRTPWALWDLRSGDPSQGASTLEAIEVLEKGMERIAKTKKVPHPGILHMYIHVMEMSPFPHKALRASDHLRELVPDVGHLCHMPSHIDVRCGHYYEAVVANDRASAADRNYVRNEGLMNNAALSRIHNLHLKVYAAMFLGQYSESLSAAEEMIESAPEELLRIENPAMADWVEGYIAVKAHVYIRFGRWRDIIDHPLPEDSELYSMTTATWRYAKGIAHAVRGEVQHARAEQRKFQDAVKRVPETRYLFNNTCLEVLKIADQMLNGELQYRQGNYDEAFKCLRRAVYLDDNLKYDEPWGWMQPARHALGALLLEQGYIEEARQVYMDDLGLSDTLVGTSQHIDNPWSLHGLVECLERLGEDQQARMLSARLDLARARADVPISASCACRLSHHPCDG